MLKAAYRFIRFDRAKSIGVVIGIVISTFLIGQNLGVFIFLTGLMKGLVESADADVWVVDNRTQNVNALSTLDVRKLFEIKSVPGVAKASPVVIANGQAEFADGSSAGVLLVGSTGPDFPAGPPVGRIIAGDRQALLRYDRVSADVFEEGNFAGPGSSSVGTIFEINGKRAEIAVQTKGVRGFAGSFLFTTLERARYYGNLPNTAISAVLIDVAPGYSPAAVSDEVNARVFGVRAWPAEELAASTVNSILANSGIGASTGTLIVFAIISGFFIIGLTMYSSALDRIKDYGTLKAIGASDGYIRGLILSQAGIFALVGFVIGYALLEGFKRGASRTGLVFDFEWYVVLGIFLIALFISLFGAVFALRRISNLEPAAVFR
ncbi:MAG: FtsX-like permease family protein [Bacteroidetes bacterium]|nr:MAG: FtsX-like permease family protein [Bacteroidota bacterium]